MLHSVARHSIYNRSCLIEILKGAVDAVMRRRIELDYSNCMGIVFEKVCQDYLSAKNAAGELPILFTSIGRWWGTDPVNRTQTEIHLVANDNKDYLICECKWRNEKLDLSVVKKLIDKADIFSKNRDQTWFVLFSKSGFTDAVLEAAQKDDSLILVGLDDIMALCN